MTEPDYGQGVCVLPAKDHQQEIMVNLFQYYLHDFSQFVDLKVNKKGRFEYPGLHLYWREAGRDPYFIYNDGHLAGFVLVNREEDERGEFTGHQIAEFFVLRGYRRQGIGQRSAHLIWDRYPGNWVVRVMKVNEGAVRFWKSAIKAHTGGEYQRKTRRSGDHNWIVFHFVS